MPENTQQPVITNNKQALGLVVSMLFSFVFSQYLTKYWDLVEGLQTIIKGQCALFASHVSVIAFGMNLFRMLHGYVISVYDERVSQIFQSDDDSPIYRLWDLLIMVVTFVVPVISMHHLSRPEFEKNERFYLLLVYAMPQMIYLLWDISWLITLCRKEKEIEKEKKDLIVKFKRFTQTWFVMDLLTWAGIAMVFVCRKTDVLATYFTWALLIFSGLYFIFVAIDYMGCNKGYYFPPKKQHV